MVIDVHCNTLPGVDDGARNGKSTASTIKIASEEEIGAIVVCAYIVIKVLMNDNIKTEEDVAKYLGEPTLVVIPYVKNKGNKKEEVRMSGGKSSKNKKNKKKR